MASNTFNPYRIKAEIHNRHYGQLPKEQLASIDNKFAPESWNLVQNRFQMMDSRLGLLRALNFVDGDILNGQVHITGHVLCSGATVWVETLVQPPSGVHVIGPEIRYPYLPGSVWTFPPEDVELTCAELWEINPQFDDYKVDNRATLNVLRHDVELLDCWNFDEEDYLNFDITLRCSDVWKETDTPRDRRNSLNAGKVVLRTDGKPPDIPLNDCFALDLSATCRDFWRKYPQLDDLRETGNGNKQIMNKEGRVVGDVNDCWTEPLERTCAELLEEIRRVIGRDWFLTSMGTGKDGDYIATVKDGGVYPDCWNYLHRVPVQLDLAWNPSSQSFTVVGTGSLNEDFSADLQHNQTDEVLGVFGVGLFLKPPEIEVIEADEGISVDIGNPSLKSAEESSTVPYLKNIVWDVRGGVTVPVSSEMGSFRAKIRASKRPNDDGTGQRIYTILKDNSLRIADKSIVIQRLPGPMWFWREGWAEADAYNAYIAPGTSHPSGTTEDWHAWWGGDSLESYWKVHCHVSNPNQWYVRWMRGWSNYGTPVWRYEWWGSAQVIDGVWTASGTMTWPEHEDPWPASYAFKFATENFTP